MSSAVIETETTVEFEVEHLWRLHTVRGRFRGFLVRSDSRFYASRQEGSTSCTPLRSRTADDGG